MEMSNQTIIEKLESKITEFENGNLKLDQFLTLFSDSIEALEGIPYIVITEMRDLSYDIQVAGGAEEEQCLSNLPELIINLRKWLLRLKRDYKN